MLEITIRRTPLTCNTVATKIHDMPNVQFISLCLVLTFVNVVPIVAQAPPSKTSIPEEAQQRLDHMVGRWNFKTDFLSRNGDVRRTVHGTEEAKYIIEGRVVELTTTLPEQNIHSKGWLFYNSSEQQFYLTSVDNNGDHWILSGGLDLYQITSQPKKQPTGRELIIRFTHQNIT